MSEPAANVTGAFSTDCRLGITLGLSASPAVTEGSNQTVQVLLKNDLPTSNQAKYTGLPALPHGLGPLNDTFENYILPEVLDCGTSAPPDSGLASIAVYDASGFPLQLNVMEPCLLAQASAVSPPFQFNASQTISVHISLGGYWTSTDRSEPSGSTRPTTGLLRAPTPLLPLTLGSSSPS